MGLIDSYRFVPRDRFKRSREYEILPDGYFDLAFLLSESTCKIFLAGPYTQKTNVPLGHFELIIVHFKVGRMPNFINISPWELVNTMVELPRIDDLDGDTVGDWLLSSTFTFGRPARPECKLFQWVAACSGVRPYRLITK